MNITILSNTKSQATSAKGKQYFYLDLAFKDGDGKVQGRKVMPFGDSKPAYDVLQAGKAGETFNITSVKNESSGYWDWIGAKKVDGTQVEKTTVATPAGKVLGSNYETPEERARKQVYIARQSSLATAASLLVGVGAPAEDIIALAKQFEKYVFSVDTPAASISDEFNGDEDLVF